MSTMSNNINGDKFLLMSKDPKDFIYVVQYMSIHKERAAVFMLSRIINLPGLAKIFNSSERNKEK